MDTDQMTKPKWTVSVISLELFKDIHHFLKLYLIIFPNSMFIVYILV